jgi:hypothetical protein
MAVSIAEQIALKVKQRLQLIDEGDGYETTVAGTVVRPTRIWTGSPEDYQIIVVQEPLEKNPELSYPGNPPATAWNLPFIVTGMVRPSEENTQPVESLCNEFGSDMVKALTDATDWHTWNGLAIDTDFGTVENFVGDQITGVRVKFTVTFRTSENDPYTQRA